jgi:hypothetical protein
VIELLAPQQSGERLSLYESLVVRRLGCGERGIELVGVAHPEREHAIEFHAECANTVYVGRQTQPNDGFASGRNAQAIPSGGLGPLAFRVHRVGASVHDVLVKRILHIRRGIWRLE